MQQDRKLAAMENECMRIWAAIDFANHNKQHLMMAPYPLGTMVLVHQARFEVNAKFKGSKYCNCWAGPFCMHKVLAMGAYKLRELDGTIMKRSIAGNWVKQFFKQQQQSVAEMTPILDQMEDSDEFGLNTFANDGDEYLPSNSTSYMWNPNQLTSYWRPEPDWDKIWHRWKNWEFLKESATDLPGLQTKCLDYSSLQQVDHQNGKPEGDQGRKEDLINEWMNKHNEWVQILLQKGWPITMTTKS
jgi:hypothetical protein